MSFSNNPSGDNRTPFDAASSEPAVPAKRRIFSRLAVLWNEMPRANQFAVAAAGGALTVVMAMGLLNLVMASGTAQLKASYPQAPASNAPQTVIMEPERENQSAQGPLVQTEVMPPPLQEDAASQSATELDPEKQEMRRREDQIVKEKRLLEDKKRAIEQQIADKQLEEQRAAEDRKRWEERQEQDKILAEQRQQEAKRKLEEEQRKLEDEQRKLAEAH